MKSRKCLAILPLLLLLLASCTRDPKVQAQRFLDNGNKFFARGKFKEAAIMYQNALNKNRRFGEAYYRMGLTALRLGAYGDAVAMLRRAVDEQPNNSDAITKLADLYLLASLQDRKNSAELVKNVDELAGKLLSQNPKSFDGHRLEGQLALLRGDAAGSLKEFAAANETNPLQQDLIVAYVQALAANKQLPEAERLARALIEKQKAFSPIYDVLYVQFRRQNRVADAEEVLKLKCANNPANATYLMQLATHYYATDNRNAMESTIRKMEDEKAFPEGHLLSGDFFFLRLREYDRARQEYEAAVKAFPKDHAIYQKRLVELYATTGKNAEANQLLTGMLKENPKDSEVVAMRAALMLSTGDRDQINLAANDLQGLVTKTPDNHLLRFNLARALVAKNELDQAVLQLQAAIKIRPDFVVAQEVLARIYLFKGDQNKALKVAEDLITIDPSNLQAHLVRSNALLNLKNREKAHQELDFITRTYPQNAEARYQVGYLAHQEKDFKKAEQLFGDLYKADPHDPRGLMGLVETYASENRMSDSIKLMQAAVQKDPDRRDLKISLANLYVRDQQYDTAITIYKALLEKEPRSADLLFKLAETYRRKGDIELAIDNFRRSSEAAPNDTISLLQLALIMDGTGRRDQAQPFYEKILKIKPEHSVALNNLAYIKAEQGVDLDSAIGMAQRARQSDPNSTSIEDTLGWIYIKKNVTQEAVRIFKELVRKEPNNPEFHYHYAMALLQQGDKPMAKLELEAALKNNPSKDNKDKIQETLKKTVTASAPTRL